MIILRNFEKANNYFDIESKKVIQLKGETKIQGWYNMIDNSLSALLVSQNKMYFMWEEDKYLIDDDISVKLINSYFPKRNLFKLFKLKKLLVQFYYKVPDNSLNFSPFEYIDEEDFNWGEFVAKRINNKEKKMAFIGNLKE